MQWLKNLILYCLRPLERRGIQFTMRRKILPSYVVERIGVYRPHSFCPFTHFDVAWRALEHIRKHPQIEGDVVLCGVASGGLAKFILANLPSERTLWLYDTFDGGSLPGPNDSEFDRSIGRDVKEVMRTDVEKVQAYVNDAQGRCRWIVGDIMHTIPANAPPKISLLYLDTDWYESTKHELNWLEPRVSRGGIIIQDDMGLCVGAAKAVHEYYGDRLPFIVPMDEAGSVWVKL